MHPEEILNLAALILTGVATAVLAGATIGLWRATTKLVDEGKRQAGTSAELVEEMRRDRAFAQEPYLAFVHGNQVRNIGQGPALYCQVSGVARGEGADMWVTAPFHLAAGDIPQTISRWGTHYLAVAEAILGGDILKNERLTKDGGEIRVAVCEDRMGRRYRFREGVIEGERWLPSEPPRFWTEWRKSNPV